MALVKWSFKNRQYENVTTLNTGTVKATEIIHDLTVYNDLLVVSGNFINTAIEAAQNIAFYNGTRWVDSPVKELEKVNGPVLTAFGETSNFFMGGFFSKIGSKQSLFLARFVNGEIITFETNKARFHKLVPFDGHAFGIGAPNVVDPPTGFYKIFKDSVYEVNNGLERIGYINDIAEVGSRLVASGLFKFHNFSQYFHLIYYDNGTWKPMAAGLLSNIEFIATFNEALVATGPFATYRNVYLGNIATIGVTRPKSLVRGHVYFDKNNNCEFDGREENLGNHVIKIEPGGLIVRTKDDGTYNAYLDKGSYTFTVVPNKYWSIASCGSGSYSIDLANDDLVDGVDFALSQKSGIRDVGINLVSTSGPVANVNQLQKYVIAYRNVGSSDMVKGQISLEIDSGLQLQKAEPAPVSITGGVAQWDVEDLTAGEVGTITCLFKIDDEIDHNIEMAAEINQEESEEDISNNRSSLTQQLSFETVETKKYVNPGYTWGDTAYISPSSSAIEYQIAFANYSSDTVYTVYVIDTIALDNTIVSIDDISASHPVIAEAIPGPPFSDYAVLIYKFENIKLHPNPTMMGETTDDKGYILFRVNLTGLSDGVSYENTAKVVFDYDFEQTTNTVHAVVDLRLSDVPKPFIKNDLTIYPNPTTQYLTVDDAAWNASFNIRNVQGQEVLEGQLASNRIDVSHLPQGIYFLMIEHEGQLQTAKFIKQ